MEKTKKDADGSSRVPEARLVWLQNLLLDKVAEKGGALKLGIKKVKRMLDEMIEKFEEMYQDFPDTK